MPARPSWSRRFRKRVNRRLYRALFRVYRSLFPTPAWPGRVPRGALRRVLIVQPYGVGDMILTTPLIGFLKEQAPDAEIDVLASPRNAAVIAHDERVARVFLHDHTSRGWLIVVPRLRARGYDAILSGQAGRSLREGLLASAVARRHTYKISVWRPKRYHGLFTAVLRIPPSAAHTADRLLYMGRRMLGVFGPTAGDAGVRYPLRMATDAMAEARADTFVRERGLDGGFVVVNVSAHFAVRDWPPEHCAATLASLLARHPDLSAVLAPAPGKSGPAREVAARCANPRVLVAPELPLPDLTALVRRALAVLSPNTALVHLAAACRRPVVALYAPEAPGWVALWLPLGVPYRALVSRHGAPISDIPPQSVADAFDELPMRERLEVTFR
jgi:ADP-heptose:LPS heptosyltransferase